MRQAANEGGGVELLGIELLEEHARRLAALLTLARQPRGSHRSHLRQLKAHMRALREIYAILAEEVRGGEVASPAAEWLLDNFHVVAGAVRDVVSDRSK